MKTLVQKLSNNRPEDPINDPNSEINGKELDKTLKPGTMVQHSSEPTTMRHWFCVRKCSNCSKVTRCTHFLQISCSVLYYSRTPITRRGRSRPSDKGGGGVGGDGGHSDPEIGGPVSKNMFSTLRASVWCKNKGGPPHTPPGPVTDWN